LATIERAAAMMCMWRLVVIAGEKGRMYAIEEQTEIRCMKDGSILVIEGIRSYPMRNSFPDIQFVAKVLDAHRNFQRRMSFGGDWLVDVLDELDYVVRQNLPNPLG
jgi:hypothetical protein